MARQKKTYYVRCYTSGGWNYRDITNVDWQGVKDLQRTAKAIGERIEYEPM